MQGCSFGKRTDELNRKGRKVRKELREGAEDG
jgi:hypothetical protein